MTGTPWNDVPHLWKDEAAFAQWLRSSSRRTWNRHPVKLEYIRKHRYKAPVGKITSKNPKGMVWVCDCELCGVQTRKFEVDHIQQAGSTGSIQEWLIWIERLLVVGFDDIRILCKSCHDVVTLSQKLGCSFERAKYIEKPRIEFGKKKAKEQVDTLTKLGIIPSKKKEERVKQYLEWLEETYNEQI